MKTCFTCKNSKPLAEFQKKSASKDGYAGTCKVCKREYDNNHYKNNPSRKGYIKDNSRERVVRNREWVIKYLQDHPCVDCGEIDIVVLQFDHQGDKVAAVATMIFSHSLPKLQAEVDKCLVRCANCHTRKTAVDFGWMKTTI